MAGKSRRTPRPAGRRKNRKSRFGYKAHIAIGEGSEIIREAILTAADVHDSQPAVSLLIQSDEKAVYGDKAYMSEALRAKLVASGIEGRVMYQAARNTPLKSWQTRFTDTVTRIRSGVEHRFAVIKRHYGFRRVYFLGLLRNACHLQLFYADQPQARPGTRRMTAGVCLNEQQGITAIG